MSKPNTTLEELYRGIKRPVDQIHRLVLKRYPAHFLELDVGFAFNSTVLLPMLTPEEDAPKADKPRLPPLHGIAQVFTYAQKNPGQRLCVVGHTDTSGSASLNQTFSELRAQSVYALLKGDRELWASSAEKRHESRDVQVILKWAAREHGLGCDPGQIDGLPGKRTVSARERFRRSYNEKYGGSLTVTGPMTKDDWSALFDLYEITLARLLGVPQEELSSKRSLLTFHDEPTLGCGEQFPVVTVGIDGLRSASNRRVDFVFFEETGFPSLRKQTPPGLELYGTKLRFRRDVIKTEDPKTERPWLRMCLVDFANRPYAERKFRLTMDENEISGTTDADGKLEQQVDEAAKEVALTFWPYGDPDGPGVTLPLDLTGPSALDEVREAQARLHALAFYQGDVDGVLTPALTQAKRNYALARALAPDTDEQELLADARAVQRGEGEAVA